MNCNDSDMVAMPEDVFTETWYVRNMVRLASTVPLWLDRLSPIRTRKSHADILKHIGLAAELLQVMQQKFPLDVIRGKQTGGRVYPWKRIAYRCMIVGGADKRILVNRPLLPHAFQTDKFPDSRKTCVDAAMLAVVEFTRIWDHDGEGIAIWTEVATVITAIVILGLELLYRESHSDDQANSYRKVLSTVAGILRVRKADILATRAARLIDLFIASEENVVLRAMHNQGGAAETEGVMEEERLLFQLFSLTNQEASPDTGNSPNNDMTQGANTTAPVPAPAQDPTGMFPFDMLNAPDPSQLTDWFAKTLPDDLN